MVKKIIKYAKGYWKYVIATPLMVIVETLIEIYIPLVMADLIDDGIYAGNMSVITKYGFILLGATLVSLLFGVGAAFTAPIGSAGFASNLRHAMYYKVQDFDFESIDKFSTSSIITRLTTDVTNVQQSFQMITRICVRAPFMLIFALVASFSVSRKLSMIFIAVMPFLIIGMLILTKIARPIFERIFKRYDKLNNVVQENLHAVRVVKAFNRQKFENEKFKTASGDICYDFTKVEKIMAWMSPIMQTCMYVCLLMISWFGARMIVASGNNEALGLTTGNLMSLITYITQILMSLMMISVVFVMLIMAKASGDRIVEILDEKSHIENPENPVYEVKNGEIVFDNVSFRSLKDVNLTIPSGTTVGIVGATGSSKSTLVQLIPRLYDPKEGCVKVGGVDVRDYDIETLRDAVSMVLQQNILFSGSIAENLRWGNENATMEEMQHACHAACADEFIDKMEEGYDTHIEQGGTNVSGGQRQRLCIARALLKKPKVLILDDSTSACDVRTDALIRQALKGEMPDATKFIISQRISSVMDADMIIVLDDGRISAVGTHDELVKTSEIYSDVYRMQGGEIDG